jgi:anion-transporting  ArsA/GET3 family ATPase
MAAEAAAAGKRVLAIDATGAGGLDDTIRAADLVGQFETLRLTTRSSLDEYLKIYLKLPLSASRLGPLAKIFDYVSAAAPGVRELLIIGKIGWEVRSGAWDEIVVDGPATGHVVELLTAPEAMAELVPTGPLAAQTGWLSEVLSAPTTGVVVVTLPEELPVSESGELLTRLQTETATPVLGVVVNRVPGVVGAAAEDEIERLTASGSALGDVAQLARARHDVATTQLDRIEALDQPMVRVADRAASPVDAVREAIRSDAAAWLR